MDHRSVHDCLGSGEEYHTIPRRCIRLAQGALEENDINDAKSWLKLIYYMHFPLIYVQTGDMPIGLYHTNACLFLKSMYN